MSSLQREKAYEEICQNSYSFGIGIIESHIIDTIGITEAVKQAMLQALENLQEKLPQPIDYVLVDGSKTKQLPNYLSERILKGGLYHYTIAAGSILAKVTRDRIMQNLATTYPAYQFDKHVGYGTKLHQQLLSQFGPCDIHRKTFEPVKLLLSQ